MADLRGEWTAELKKGSIQLCLLALLEEDRKYGFQIIRELRDASEGFFDVKEGTLYPALRRLEERGLVSSEWVERDAGVPRKYYKLTKKGRGALSEARAVWSTMTRSVNRVIGGKA